MRIALVIAVVLVVSALGYVFWPWRDEIPPPGSAAVPAAAAQPPSGPRHPVTETEARALPALNESDPAMVEALSRLLGMDTLGRILNPEGLVRNIVATIDNLSRETVAQRLNPVRPIGGLPVTAGKDETLILAPRNATRYAAYVRIAESLDAARLAATYKRFYPLFQQAYVDLGYPNGYFNDRLIEVIDHLLETPELAGLVKLVQPKVLYEFADPALEERSAGQKAMLRIGNENAARVKARLREIRREILSQTGPGAKPQ